MKSKIEFTKADESSFDGAAADIYSADEVAFVSQHDAKPHVSSSGKCSRCQKNDASEDHTCPYAEEINDDHESLCDCCADCEYECGMDI